MAEQIGREAESKPDEEPKVNVHGIEELVTDKGYHSSAVVEQVKSYQLRSYIPEPRAANCWPRPASGRDSTSTRNGLAPIGWTKPASLASLAVRRNLCLSRRKALRVLAPRTICWSLPESLLFVATRKRRLL